MDVHQVLQNPVGTPLVNWEVRRPRLKAAMVGTDEVPVTPDLAEPLVDMRVTVTRLINDLVAGIDPSTADWRELTAECITVGRVVTLNAMRRVLAHLRWCARRPGLR